jgi:hypothetical protein
MSKIKASRNLRTKAWGPVAWFAITCFLMGYPEKNPTTKDKKHYKSFLNNIGNVLPCNLCRDSYIKFIKELPITPKVLSSRKNLVYWFFKLHNKVNRKLKCKELNTTSMNDKYKFYDKFRAVKCGPELGGCMKAGENVRVPRRTKVVTIIDKHAIKLRKKEMKMK